eukprot:gene496-934_t
MQNRCLSNIQSIEDISNGVIPVIPLSLHTANSFPSLMIPFLVFSSLITTTAKAKADDAKSSTGISLLSDEFIIEFTDMSLGLSLAEQSYGGFPVVIVKRIVDDSVKMNHPELREGAIIVKVGLDAVDGLSRSKIVEKIQKASRPTTLTFRDPSRFFELLDSSDPDLNASPLLTQLQPSWRTTYISSPSFFDPITSEYLPAGAREKGSKAQVLEVQRINLPPLGERGRSSKLLDVMEIRYVARVVQVGDRGGVKSRGSLVVDNSANRAPPGSSSGSIYLVLGQRNGAPGPVPPGWDLTLRGMVVGERRRIVLPPAVAFDLRGLRNEDGKLIAPPGATIEYDVELLSLT